MTIALRPLRNPNSLGFPGGVLPGFDPTHPASVGITQGHGFSGIAFGANFMSLLNSTPGTLSGTPTASILNNTGPCTNVTGTQVSTFGGNLAKSDLSATLACIVQLNALNSASTIFFASTNGTAGGWAIGLNASNQLDMFGEGGTSQASVTIGALSANVPYFMVVSSAGTGTATKFLLLRLDTGKILTDSTAAAVATGSTATATYSVGNLAATRPANAKIAAVMWTPQAMSAPAIAQWAQDPWSFWYPRNVSSIVGVTAGSSFLAAWAMNSNMRVIGTGTY